jgi:hypothetical protein
MPGLRLTIGAREQMELAIVEATPLGLLDTEAVVRIGVIEIRERLGASRLAVPVGSFCVGTPVIGASSLPSGQPLRPVVLGLLVALLVKGAPRRPRARTTQQFEVLPQLEGGRPQPILSVPRLPAQEKDTTALAALSTGEYVGALAEENSECREGQSSRHQKRLTCLLRRHHSVGMNDIAPQSVDLGRLGPDLLALFSCGSQQPPERR